MGARRGNVERPPIMAAMITGRALGQLKCSYVGSFKDMTNAFPSVGWQYMEQAAAVLVRERDRGLKCDCQQLTARPT
eukprot:7736876-Pyramimonas_sp.AAC.1